MSDTDALAALLKWQIRGPCEQYAYSECRYCHATWWDHEQHNLDCIVPAARVELAARGVVVLPPDHPLRTGEPSEAMIGAVQAVLDSHLAQSATAISRAALAVLQEKP